VTQSEIQFDPGADARLRAEVASFDRLLREHAQGIARRVYKTNFVHEYQVGIAIERAYDEKATARKTDLRDRIWGVGGMIASVGLGILFDGRSSSAAALAAGVVLLVVGLLLLFRYW
jgi:hypothetical protein